MSTTTPSSSPLTSGLFFEDLSVGMEMPSSSPRTITQEDIRMFALISGDRNPIHLDESFAAGTRFGGIVAHGLLCTSVASGLAWEMGLAKTAAIFREITTTFLRPVRPGDQLSLKLKVLSTNAVQAERKEGEVKLEAILINQRGKTVQHGIWSVLVSKKPT